MLKTNSKKAKENIKNYITDNFNPVNYSPLFDHVNDFPGIATAIMETFESEYLKHNCYYKAGRISKQTLFVEWCSGLPSILDTCYYYNRSAVDDLGGDPRRKRRRESTLYRKQGGRNAVPIDLQGIVKRLQVVVVLSR